MNDSTLIKVDCIIIKNDQFEIEKFSRHRRSQIDGFDFRGINKEDLIISKLKWAADSHSERQLDDIRTSSKTGVDDAIMKDRISRTGQSEVRSAFEAWKMRLMK